MFKITKRSAAICAIWIWAAGYVITISAASYWPLVIGRAVKGLAMGFLSGIIPPYIQECFNENRTSLMLSLFQIFFPVGIFVMGAVAYLGCLAPFSIFKFNCCWSLMMILTMPAVLLSFFIRTSPNDFLIRGYNAHAIEALSDMYEDPIEVNKQMDTLFVMCRRQAETPKMEFIKDAFRPEKRRRIFLAIFSQASMQLTGINVISNYTGQAFLANLLPY